MIERRPVRLCLFVKAPVAGRVKTRLAAGLGAEQALAAYVTLVERELEALADLDMAIEMWVAGDLHHRQVRSWARRYALRLRRQPAGDLGGRMHAAIRHCSDAGCAGIVIGSDLPEVDAAYVDRAAALLAGHDLVLGPTEDGGYALIGMHSPNATLFADIAWGTGRVHAQTMEQARRLGLTVAQLATTWDVDDLRDWRRFLGE